MPHWTKNLRAAGQAVPSGSFRAYHGSPHDFDRFDASKIGKGEGNQAYGHGLYFADNEDVASRYRMMAGLPDVLAGGQSLSEAMASLKEGTWYGTAISPRKRVMGLLLSGASEPSASSADKLGAIVRDRIRTPYWHSPDPSDIAASDAALDELLDLGVEIGPRPGRSYEVEIAHPEEAFLDWDQPVLSQPRPVVESMRAMGVIPGHASLTRWKGGDAYQKAVTRAGHDRYSPSVGRTAAAVTASQMLQEGVPGIKYFDAGSRGAGQGTRNYVIFPGAEDKIRILRKYGLLGPLLAAPAAAAPQQDRQPSFLDGLRTN
jgi:hypothetical protein